MKLKTLGRAALALAASAVSVLGMTSCSRSFTVGYFFVTGSSTGAGTNNGLINTYRIKNTTGELLPTASTSSAGVNPIQVVVGSSGTFLYVLNSGCGNDGQAACSGGSGASAQPSSIDLFTVGGRGVLTHQQSYFPKGINTIAMQVNGNYLYTLDEFAPADASGTGHQSYGAISAFQIDQNTGRLTALLNQQQKDTVGQPLTYFPIGTNPVWMTLSGSYAYVAEQGAGTPTDPSQAIFIYAQNTTNGQLTLTQSTPTPTGATQLTYVYANGSTIYALDAGTTLPASQAGNTNATGQILIYTVSSGTLGGGITPRANTAQGAQGRFPSRLIENDSRKFIWVANSGVNTAANTVGSVITAYSLQSNGELGDANTGNNIIPTGSGPSCLLEDPSNQYVYITNFQDSTITGKKIDQNAGALTALPKGMPAPPGSPTWCAASGSTF